MATVGLVLHQERPLVRSLAHEATTWLRAHGHRPVLTAEDAALAGVPADADTSDFGHDLDVVLSLGGDGTMLRTVHMAAPYDVDVLGVNVGHMGYLTEVEPAGLVDALERYFAGDFGIERRMLMEVSVHVGDTDEPSITDHVLNEAVIEKVASGHTVRLGVALDGDHFTTYATDGLIVATPTGSTAYAFSARGPIVDPIHRALLLTPVAPHMLFDRSLVLDPATEVTVSVRDHRPASVAVDGRPISVLGEGDTVRCRASEHTARLVTFGPREFHRILKTKFGLNER
ncbi:MAG: NAD(+)/NADH kinase [Acidimicrobiia bacterium]|nr:NAD(+)/NADH kinase [Acidimicrobiia bacterium]